MAGLPSLVLVAGTVSFVSALAFMAWRRSGRRTAASTHITSVVPHVGTDPLAEEKVAIPAEGIRSEAERREFQSLPNDFPPVQPVSGGISIENASPPPNVSAIELQVPSEAKELPQECANRAGSPTAIAAGAPSSDQPDNVSSFEGCATAIAEERPGDRDVRSEMGVALVELPSSDMQLDDGKASAPLVADGGSFALDPAEPVEHQGRRATAVDNISDSSAGSVDDINLVLLENFSAAEAIASLPAETQHERNDTSDLIAESVDSSDRDEAPTAAATHGDSERAGSSPVSADLILEQENTSANNEPVRPAKYRDRRGKRRATALASTRSGIAPVVEAPGSRPPAEAKLRLSLHPIRRTVTLSLVLARQDGFPPRVTLHIDGHPSIEAYNDRRYDDLDLPWTGELLESELRVASAEGFQWLRSGRQVHIFAEEPSEPDLISVGTARTGLTYTLICRSRDVAAVSGAAASTGSPELSRERWQGIPEGWAVLSGYRPVRAASSPLVAGLRPLDPGAGIEIGFEGSGALRPRAFAEGRPPRITISPGPEGGSVTIGGQPAALAANGGWEAPGWDAPGHHVVDIVPGPSASYEIVADPWDGAGWEFWNAHAGRFGDRIKGPWAKAEICGASIRGPAGRAILAIEAQPILIALGARSGITPLQRRTDVPVSVGFAVEPPAFLISATGQRRRQGQVIWLGLVNAECLNAESLTRLDAEWAAAVRSAASRHLPLERADSVGEDAWRQAKMLARRLKRPHR